MTGADGHEIVRQNVVTLVDGAGRIRRGNARATKITLGSLSLPSHARWSTHGRLARLSFRGGGRWPAGGKGRRRARGGEHWSSTALCATCLLEPRTGRLSLFLGKYSGGHCNVLFDISVPRVWLPTPYGLRCRRLSALQRPRRALADLPYLPLAAGDLAHDVMLPNQRLARPINAAPLGAVMPPERGAVLRNL